jgi:hypothetical protein
MGEIRIAYKLWSGNLDGKRLLGRTRLRHENNIKIGIKQIR